MKNIDRQQKSIQFPDDLAGEIEQLAEANERSFSAEVVYAMDAIPNVVERSACMNEPSEVILQA